MTAFNSHSITYDAGGNPLTYYNGTDWSFTWEGSRQLASASGNGHEIFYTYDLNGLRTSKTVDGVLHTYYYAGGRLLREVYGNTVLDFAYDASGNPFSLTYNGTKYYYVTNLQGDVYYLVDTSGNTVASYTYDPFGKVLTAAGEIAEINPLRYRGYYYDTDSGFYYLQSRYYDPAICRFINADSYASTGQGFVGNNMFAYGLNTPVNCSDPLGHDVIWINEGNGAGYMGHAGFLIQDPSTGIWYFFYWGKSQDSGFWDILFGTKSAECVVVEIGIIDEDNLTPEGIKDAMIAAGGKAKERAEAAGGSITFIHFKGDYSEAYEIVNNYKISDSFPCYSLFGLNCLQMSVSILAESNPYFSYVLSTDSGLPSPNDALPLVLLLPRNEGEYPTALLRYLRIRDSFNNQIP